MVHTGRPQPPLYGRPSRSRRGVTTVEFALTAPILFALLWGAVEFSRSNMLVHTASIAATEAARTGIIPGATAEECRAAGLRELNVIGVSEASLEVSPDVINDDTTQITINLTIPIASNGYILPRTFLGKEVFKSVTLQREGKHDDDANEAVTGDGMRTIPSDDAGGAGDSDDSGSSGGG